MKVILFSCMFFFYLFQAAITQAQSSSDNHSYRLEEGIKMPLIADRVNVRASASKTAEVIANIPIGTMVKIVKNSDKGLTIGGYQAPWAKISFQKNGEEKIGYIWSGLIAAKHFKAEDGTLIMYGISTLEAYKDAYNSYDKVMLQMRACRKNKELDKIEFKAVGSLMTSHNGESTGNRGLGNVKDVFVLGFSDDRCGGAFGDVFVFWAEDKLWHVKTLRSGSDAPVFSSSNFIFPEDELDMGEKIIRGKANTILWYEAAGEYGEEGGTVYDYQRTSDWIWNGSKLVKQKG